ncbi:MAG: transposase [Phycisphaerae bacterium]|nr:transposase [Phycisphaerae bacterium]
MACKRQTQVGRTSYHLRMCTVEPIFAIIKELAGFRQFALAGFKIATGEWVFIGLALHLKRMHTLIIG